MCSVNEIGVRAMQHICVFCGSSSGNASEYRESAIQLGHTLAQRNLTLVYGGASVGLMGLLADTVLENGGKVIGFIPQRLVDHEIAHRGLTELHIVGSMHERKARMSECSDGFIALPGGSGTLEEYFEVLTWAQLGYHRKPCGLLNVNGYYTPLLSFFDHMVAEGFLKETYRKMVLAEDDPQRLLSRFNQYQAPDVVKWAQK